MKADSVIDQKSVAFGIRIVKVCRFLQENKKEFVLSKQLLRSGTAIGAMIKESEFAESKAASQANGNNYTPARPEPSAASGDGFMNIPDGIDEELPFN